MIKDCCLKTVVSDCPNIQPDDPKFAPESVEQFVKKLKEKYEKLYSHFIKKACKKANVSIFKILMRILVHWHSWWFGCIFWQNFIKNNY